MSRFLTASIQAIASSCLLMVGGELVYPARSQPIPDATLPVASQVDQSVPNLYRVTGGTPAENNLFHSFEHFNLVAGEVAQFEFEDSRAIANAIIRVTGDRASQIDGTIASPSPTNLIFLNPRGWLFGANAQLDVGGAIAISSAEAVVFADGSFFPSFGVPTEAALLSVAVPIGLQLGAGSPEITDRAGGTIEILGNGHDLTVTDPILAPIERNGATDGLRGAPANLLMLAGETVSIHGGTVTAASGQLSIVAGRNGVVPLGLTSDRVGQLNPEFEFGDISLRQAALLDVTGPVSGRIDLVGDRVRITEGSIVLSQQFDDRAPDFPGAGLFIFGDREVFLAGATADGRLQTRVNSATLQGSRRGPDVVIRTDDLIVADGAAIATRSFSAGRGGDLSIEATHSVQLLDANATVADFFSSLTATSLVAGRAGDLSVTADRIFARDGGTIASSTFGLGDGGNVSVVARDRIDIVGADTRQFSPSVIIASSFGVGNAGNLAIAAPEIVLSAGGRIDASSFNAGAAGTVTVFADRLTVAGTAPNSVNRTAIIASANTVEPALQALLNVSELPTGDSGDVRLSVEQLDVRDGATVTVRNNGTGDAGRLEIVTDRLTLSDRGSLSATTNSGSGGNIAVEVRDSLQLRQQGSISATAGGTGNGGNIELSAPTIVALDNSDITANAIAGQGGNIRLNTQGLFGATPRSSPTPGSDITASSNLGLTGSVELNTSDLTGTQAAVVLPDRPLNLTNLIQTDCHQLQQGQFTVVGQSGQGINPERARAQPLRARAQFPLDRGPSTRISHDRPSDLGHPDHATDRRTEPQIFYESQAWQIGADGTIKLLDPRSIPATATTCHEHNPPPTPDRHSSQID